MTVTINVIARTQNFGLPIIVEDKTAIEELKAKVGFSDHAKTIDAAEAKQNSLNISTKNIKNDKKL